MRFIWHDIRYGVRMLLKQPGFTAIAALMLALSIGANTAIFSVADAVLLRPLPYKEPERLALVQQYLPQLGWYYGGVSAAELLDYTAGNKTFAEMAGYSVITLNLTDLPEPQLVKAARVSPNLFSLLGVAPIVGRGFSPEEDEAGKNQVAVISESLWRKQFGADRGVVGRNVKLDERPYTVVGVMPMRLQFPPAAATFADAVEIWVPLTLTDNEKQARRRDSDFNLIGRLAPGVTLEQAQANMADVAGQIERQYPNIYRGNAHITATVVGLTERTVQGAQMFLFVLLSAVGLVLLIACANVANLLLAQASARRREVAIRIALGAGTGRIVRQLLTESLMLALGGGVLGLFFARWAIEIFTQFGPENIPRLKEAEINLRVLGFTLLASLSVGVLSGLAPALQSLRLDIATALKDAARAMGKDGVRLRSALVILETAIAAMLLIGAGLLFNSFVRLWRVAPGFNPDGVVVARTTLPAARYPEPERGKDVYRRVLQRVAALPGVQSVGVASALPLQDTWEIGVLIEGRIDPYPATGSWVSGDYFRAMGISLKHGRSFGDEDRVDTPPVVVVNETMANRFWPGEEAVGKRIRWGGWNPEGWLTIVGVVGDVKMSTLEAASPPTVYIPIFQVPRLRRDVTFIARTSGDTSNLAAGFRREIRAVDSELPVYDARAMNQVVAESLARRRFMMWILGLFAASALLLAAIGLYGVMSYSVTQRTQEFGLRMALGASPADVRGMIVRQGMKLAGIGLLGGIASALVMARFVTGISGLLYEVTATDPVTFILISLLLLLVALIACLTPAWQATRVNPLVALRAS